MDRGIISVNTPTDILYRASELTHDNGRGPRLDLWQNFLFLLFEFELLLDLYASIHDELDSTSRQSIALLAAENTMLRNSRLSRNWADALELLLKCRPSPNVRFRSRTIIKDDTLCLDMHLCLPNGTRSKRFEIHRRQDADEERWAEACTDWMRQKVWGGDDEISLQQFIQKSEIEGKNRILELISAQMEEEVRWEDRTPDVEDMDCVLADSIWLRRVGEQQQPPGTHMSTGLEAQHGRRMPSAREIWNRMRQVVLILGFLFIMKAFGWMPKWFGYCWSDKHGIA